MTVLPDLLTRIRQVAEQGPLPAERLLAEELGVSRYVLRKALSDLRRGDDIPPAKPRNPGKSLQTPDIALRTSPVEVWEMRLTFEPEIARLAAVNGSELELRDIEEAHARSEVHHFDLAKDIAFHRAIAVASHNTFALHLMDQVHGMTQADYFRSRLPRFTEETGYSHHATLVAAIAQRRPQAAEAAMRAHIQAILDWLRGTPPPKP